MNPDPRVQKYIDYYEQIGIEYRVIGWNRGQELTIKKKNHLFFELKAAYGMKMKNVGNKLRWFAFIIKYLIVNRKQYQKVHACDFDTAFPVYLASRITRKKYIFDVFDWVGNDNNLIYKLIAFIETYIAKKAENIIICEEERKKQIGIKRNDILIMPNIPNDEYIENIDVKNKILALKSQYKIVLSYVGVFDTHRGIEDFLEYVSNNNDVLLNIAGFGLLEQKVISYSNSNSNIVFWGKVDYHTGLTIMKNSNLIFSMYYKSNPLHVFAAPNKYYEGLMLGTPIITTRNTLVGNKTERYDTGFVIEEGIENIKKLFRERGLLEEISKKRNECNVLWGNKYKNHINEFMDKLYSNIIRS